MKSFVKNNRLHTYPLILVIMCSYLVASEERANQEIKINAEQNQQCDSPDKNSVQIGQKVRAFLQNNALTLISLVCTLTSLYMTYYFSNESHKLAQASFLIDKGGAALKNIGMVAAGKYNEYRALVAGK